MTKSADITPDGESGPTTRFAAAAAGSGQGESSSSSDPPGSIAEAAGEDAEDDLALEVEIEEPEPAPPTLEQRLIELEGKCKETYDRYIRSVAELDNYRKRTRKEIDDARIDAQSRVLREMLPVIDNLERALAAAGGAEVSDGHGIIEGVRLVMRQFAQALERSGVTPVLALGAPFDPTQHEAVSQRETADTPPGTVADVLQSGYRIGDRLLRPALVVVARAPASAAAGGGGSQTDREDGGDSPGPNGHDPDAA